MRNSKAYPKCKPSGVEWLGDVPEHWETKRLKYSFRLLTTKAEEKTNPVALENIESWTGRFIETETEFDGEGVTFKKDDILFGKLRPYLAKVLKTEGNGEAVGDFFVMRPQGGINPDYAAYFLRSEGFIDIIDGSTFGSKMPRASWDFMGSVRISLPPLAEQAAIAEFLDGATGRIDALVDKKKRLVALLREKRTAMISRAVTGGLDPTAKRKPSAVEWLGDVPEHWEVKRLKYSTGSSTGFAFSSDDYIDEGVPLIRIGDILDDGSVDISSTKKLPDEYLERYSSLKVANNDILMAMTGATIGKAGRYKNDTPGLLNQRVCKFIPVSINQLFLWYTLTTIQYAEHIRLTGFGGAQPNISDKELLEFTCAIPPLPEQQAIADYLDKETGKIDALVAKVEAAIEKLNEYRTAIISAAVTGKIDVSKEVYK